MPSLSHRAIGGSAVQPTLMPWLAQLSSHSTTQQKALVSQTRVQQHASSQPIEPLASQQLPLAPTQAVLISSWQLPAAP